ncbi:hypothetical protein ACF0H5_020638 [Mactra antiquata]
MFSAGLLRNAFKASQQFKFRQPVRNFKPKRPQEVESVETTIKPENIEKEIPINHAPHHKPETPVLGRYFVYTAVAIPTFFTGCMIWQYENIQKLLHQKKQPKQNEPITKTVGFREHLRVIWNHSMSNTQKMYVGILSLNAAVLCLWRVGSLRPYMYKYFTSLPLKANSVTSATLSAFSHSNFLHFAVNMYVLYSFSNLLIPTLGREQFLAVYLSGATFSSLTSCVFRVTRRSMIPSIGASGAILTVLSMCCLLYPNSRLSIAFIGEIFPHSFSAQSGLMAVVLLDCAGIIFRWKLFDHAAHLGGVIFGYLYLKFGHKLLWEKYRKSVFETWKVIRKRIFWKIS